MTQLNSVIPANEARTNFYQILDEIDSGLSPFTVTHRGKSKAIIMSAEDYEGWLATTEIMADPKLVTRLKKAKADFKAGKGIPEDKVKKILGW